MAKYSIELKMKVVDAYLNGEGGYISIAQEYGISSHSIVEKWVKSYLNQGYEGLKVSRKNNNYSFEFKLNVVKLYLTGEMSYQSLANEFKINNPSMIANWVKKYRKQGVEGLRPKKRGRPKTMTKDQAPKNQEKKEKSQEDLDEIQRLKEENYWLQMELDFVKKKIELREREEELRKRRK